MSLIGATISIAEGSISVTVSGLGLASVPGYIFITIESPNGESVIYGSVRQDTITTDGFIVDLSGITPSAGYNLDYILNYGAIPSDIYNVSVKPLLRSRSTKACCFC